MTDFANSPPSSVLIVMLSALGDAVHVLPVANAIRRKWPETRITWIIQPVAYQLVRGHPAIDEFILFRRRRGVDAWKSYNELQEVLRGRRFDLALGLQVYLKAGLITGLVPATVKLGFDLARARDMNWLFTTERIRARPVGHVQDQYFEFLEHIGVDPEPVVWDLHPSDDERIVQREFFGRFDRPACAFVVATSKPQKNWAPDRYARLIERADDEHGLQPILIGGPAPIERRAAGQILDSTRATVIDALGDDVRRLLWLIDGSRLVVSPDTGPLHMARAMDVPVVGLYGFTNPKRYGPYRKFSELVVDGYARRPDELYGPSMRHRPGGMKRVTVEAATERVALALERYPPR